MTESSPTWLDQSATAIRAAAFRSLLRKGQPVSVADLAAELTMDQEDLASRLADMDHAGRIMRDPEGNVVASAGLSVVRSRHRLLVGDRRFWTWCAYDALGILGALRASGKVDSLDPRSGEAVELAFIGGEAKDTAAVLFKPAERYGTGYHEWCPLANLFTSQSSARAWADREQVQGEILSIAEGTRLGAADWGPIVLAPSELADNVRAAAFRRLMSLAAPVSAAELAAELRVSVDVVRGALQQLLRHG